MTAAIDLGISTGFGLLVGLVAYLVMWLFDLVSQPQRFPHRGAHIERPRAAEIDLVGGHHGGSVAADLHHHERQWGAAIEAGAAAAEAGRGDVMCLGAVQAGSAQCGNDRGAGGGIDGFGVGHERRSAAWPQGGVVMAIDLAKLRALAEAATPGPWVIGIDRLWSRALPDGDDAVIASYAVRSEDTAYVAAANPLTALALIAEIERLEAERDARPEIAPNVSDLLATMLEVERACRDEGESHPLWWDIAIPALRAHAAKAVSR